MRRCLMQRAPSQVRVFVYAFDDFSKAGPHPFGMPVLLLLDQIKPIGQLVPVN